ncbi:aminotransferase class V-fold PLP-dependent enzyme, partial [Streptomyces clavifer]
KVAAFINAPSRNEVIFTKNASESLNLVANMLAANAERSRGFSMSTDVQEDSRVRKTSPARRPSPRGSPSGPIR